MRIDYNKLFRNHLRNPKEMLNVLFHLPQIIRVYFRLLGDKRVQIRLKAILIGAFVYAISPLDLLPDFLIPFIGYVDDLVILIVAMKHFLRRIPPHILNEHVQAVQGRLEDYK